MNNLNMYYPNYYSGYNNIYNWQPYTAFYHPYTQNLPNNSTNSIQNNLENTQSYQEKKISDSLESPNIKSDTILENKKNQKEGFRLGPLDISKERLSIFGFEIALDDLILIALILFLFFETDCDYSILIVLGLMLFNISFSSLDFF